ncbi:hypothetical protein QMK19_00130 [Streptomyces sp. H10-C2]|uniref:hypothetical protein n=1 Tax=unclassified Streptomyces TaxID=2593676 RepID=UPI0024B8DBB5|nr:MULTISPECIES: hypothetical protein [unclassified Streptomyces]MDJ0340421.1 hypothetical protein [Streptomyces sp. PH10-H1]MDJ0368131.1 hypothetical protein [Streptomyces sp. H10-C2]
MALAGPGPALIVVLLPVILLGLLLALGRYEEHLFTPKALRSHRHHAQHARHPHRWKRPGHK